MKMKKRTIIISLGIEFIKKRKEYREYIDSELIKLINSCGYNVYLLNNFYHSNYNINNEKYISYIIKKLNVCGIILPGGADFGIYKKRDQTELYLIRLSIRKNIPLLGICRGLQIINLFFKGKHKKIKNHVKKINKIEIYERYLNIKCYHNNSISKIGSDLKILSKSKDGCIESIKHKKYSIYGWMWHPERNLKYKIYFTKELKKIFN